MELPPNPGGDKGFFTEAADVLHGKRKPTLTDVESVKAQRLESVASRVPTLQALAWRALPTQTWRALPELVLHSVYESTYPPPPVSADAGVWSEGWRRWSNAPHQRYSNVPSSIHTHPSRAPYRWDLTPDTRYPGNLDPRYEYDKPNSGNW